MFVSRERLPRSSVLNLQMADEFLRSRLYEYGANSNLVLEADRESRKRSEDGKGEVESLRGFISQIHMGERVKSTRSNEFDIEKSNKRLKVGQESIEVAKSHKKISYRKKQTVLSVIDEVDVIGYQPKTRETKSAYDDLLIEVQKIVGDQPQEILKGAANEILEVLKDDTLSESKKLSEITKVTSKTFSPTDFHRIIQAALRISDYNSSSGISAANQDETPVDEEMAVVFEEDEDIEDLEDDNDEELEGDETIDVDLDPRRQLKGKQEKNTASLDSNENIQVHDIDAYWLQRQLSKYYSDANISSKIAEESLQLLGIADERLCENKLVTLLDFDKFELIKILVKNRKKLYYCIRLKQAQTDKERSSIEEEMIQDTSGFGKLLLKELNTKESVANWTQSRLGDLAIKAQLEVNALTSVTMVDTSNAENNLNDSTILLSDTINYDDLTFQDEGYLMSNQKCELPEKSWRAQKKGYEEVHIPALKAVLVQNEHLKNVASLSEWMQPAFEGMKYFNRVQSKIADFALNGEGNLLLCAPTGSGKTNVALLCMLGLISKYRSEKGVIRLSDFKIVYVAPMKALVQECVQNFSKRLNFLGVQVKELSGDQTLSQLEISGTQIIITTPEKWDIITRKAGDRSYTQLVRLVIIDEVHLLHDDRGPVLEALIARILRNCEHSKAKVRLVGLSATLPNYKDVAAFMKVDPLQGLFHFDSSYRPVPLQQQFIGLTEKKALKKLQIMNEICYEKSLLHAGKNQILIFTHSRADTVKTARALMEMAIANDTLNRFIHEQSASSEILKLESSNAKNPDLQELIKAGFAIHHAGLVRADRTLVEDLFADKHIQVLVSTATLAWGVNLPCHTVIIKGTQIYSPEKGKWVELSPLDILQMMGRAGRYGLDSEGEGIILTNHSELQYYLSLMNQQLPIESHMIKKMPDLLNAEIVLGTIQTIKDAASWLGYSYLFVRMLQNPSLYGIDEKDTKNDVLLWHRRLQLVHAAATLLERRNLIRYDRRSGYLQSTYIGRIASYYYVNHDTIATYIDTLRPSMNEIELLRLFSLSGEFRNIFIRDEERLELAKIVSRVPIPIKENLDEPSSKVNVLLQAYISRLKLEVIH